MSRQSATREDVRNYMEGLKTEFPGLKIHEKRARWLDWIFHLPLIKKLEWYNATQAIGKSIYLSDQWDNFTSESQMGILLHERQHLLQFQKYGVFLMAILYLFVFFPVGLAYFRAKFERQGYAQSVLAKVRYHGATKGVYDQCKEMYLRTFTTSFYFWTWPFKKQVLAWFEEDWERATR